MRIELFGVGDAAAIERAVAIRFRVFVDEQGVPPDEELDEHDRSDGDAVHALAYAGDEPVGTGRFYVLDEHSVQIGRMAVLPGRRETGTGRLILEALMAEARRRGFTRACLFAQVSAQRFYERAGYVAEEGAALEWDAGLLHLPMERFLGPAPNI
jgi:predicted GNAT family N-acyltransferase